MKLNELKPKEKRLNESKPKEKKLSELKLKELKLNKWKTNEKYPSEMKLLDYIEGRNVPLIRFGRWPDGARSAMSVTGDLDALSLGDYLTRLYIS